MTIYIYLIFLCSFSSPDPYIYIDLYIKEKGLSNSYGPWFAQQARAYRGVTVFWVLAKSFLPMYAVPSE